MQNYTHAYIYLIREREFLVRDEPVFKIGRGEQDADRVVKRVATGYKKGSEIWLTIRCPISLYKQVESTLKSTFRDRFTQHGDGSEYFSGDPTEMIQIITRVVHNAWSELAVQQTEQGNSGVQTIINTIKQNLAEHRAFVQEEQIKWEKFEAAQISALNQLQRLLAADIRSCSS